MLRRSAWWLAAVCVALCMLPWPALAKGKKRRSVAISQSYVRMRSRWHQRAPKALVQSFARETPWPALTLAPVGDGPRQRLMPLSAEGGFDPIALEQASIALAEKRSGMRHPIEPRLLDLMYAAAKNFSAPFVHVVSGYRQERGNSRHGQGRAVDMVLPGVSDAQLASFLRKQGFVGVGIYHRAGFVHLDVRARSYFFSDNSAPGARSRPRPIMREAAQRFDALALRRGVTPTIDAPDAIDAEGGESGDEDTAPPGDGAIPVIAPSAL